MGWLPGGSDKRHKTIPFLFLAGQKTHKRASQVVLVVKNLPANAEDQEFQVQSLGQEDPLEEGTATHSNILAWKIPWTEVPSRLQSIGSQRVGQNLSDLACMPLLLRMQSSFYKERKQTSI